MRKIYSGAREVFVHLGHAERGTSLGLELMLRLASAYSHVSQPDKFGALGYEDMRLPGGAEIWLEYYKIFASPYFRRTWILQEIALSRKTTLSLGRFRVAWNALEDSVSMLKLGENPLQRARTLAPEITEGILGLIQIREIRQVAESPNAHSLVRILKATRNFQVSDPRDKIIAVLGLIGDLPAEVGALADYRLSVSQVYHRAALHLIRTGYATEVLEHAGLQRGVDRPGLPSWAPDWVTESRENNNPPLSIFRPAPFSAGGSSQPGIRIGSADENDPDAAILLALGTCHHKIVAVSHLDESSRVTMQTSSPEVYLNWYRHAEQCWKNANNLIYPDAEEAFARTLLVNDTYSGMNKVKGMTTITNVVPVFRSAIGLLNRLSRSASDGIESEELVDSRQMDQIKTFLMQSSAAAKGRRLAVTDTGYLCLVPARAEVGDLMAVLFGLHTPFVIRPTGERSTVEYDDSQDPQLNDFHRLPAQLVGDAYMHGAMEGEVMQELEQLKRRPTVIMLA